MLGRETYVSPIFPLPELAHNEAVRLNSLNMEREQDHLIATEVCAQTGQWKIALIPLGDIIPGSMEY